MLNSQPLNVSSSELLQLQFTSGYELSKKTTKWRKQSHLRSWRFVWKTTQTVYNVNELAGEELCK